MPKTRISGVKSAVVKMTSNWKVLVWVKYFVWYEKSSITINNTKNIPIACKMPGNIGYCRWRSVIVSKIA